MPRVEKNDVECDICGTMLGIRSNYDCVTIAIGELGLPRIRRLFEIHLCDKCAEEILDVQVRAMQAEEAAKRERENA